MRSTPPRCAGVPQPWLRRRPLHAGRIVALLALLDSSAHGELFKCVENGKTSYQDKPCAASSKTEVMSIGPARSSLTGCYEIDFPGFDSAAPRSIERWRIATTDAEEYTLHSLAESKQPPLHMKKATTEERKVIEGAFGFRVTDGLSMKFDKETPNQKPVGLYRIVDAGGKPQVFAFFFMANGFAKPITCR